MQGRKFQETSVVTFFQNQNHRFEWSGCYHLGDSHFPVCGFHLSKSWTSHNALFIFLFYFF